MFIGHFGVGFGAKAPAPRVSLGTLFLAAQFMDLLWPTLLLLGVERVAIVPTTTLTPLEFTHYPYSHSLLLAVVYGLLFGAGYYLYRKHLKSAIVLGLCVVSHWVLDLIVHRPDLPLTPAESIKVGFGLWNHPVAEIIVEGLIFVVGVYFYLRVTRAKNRIGGIAFWALVVFLVVIHLTNLLGPPPPSVTAIAWAGQLQWLIVAWGYWVDHNRVSRQS
jgi:multisubunit Na+/H+ antiporter MnhC subunit